MARGLTLIKVRASGLDESEMEIPILKNKNRISVNICKNPKPCERSIEYE